MTDIVISSRYMTSEQLMRLNAAFIVVTSTKKYKTLLGWLNASSKVPPT